MNRTPLLQKNDLVLLTALGGLYLVTRLAVLTGFPITSDEATHIHWAQIILGNIREILIAKTDGRQPLFSWLALLPVAIADDPLRAARLISVAAGAAVLSGLYVLGRDLWRPSAGVLAALVYVVCPYALFYDRLAVPGTLANAFGVWALVITRGILDRRACEPHEAIRLGLLLGLALLADATALWLLPVVALLLTLDRVHRSEGFWKQAAIVLALALGPTLFILLTGPKVVIQGRMAFFHDPAAWLPLSLLATFPVAQWMSNLWQTWQIYASYLMLPTMLLLAVAAVQSARHRPRAELALWLWFALPAAVTVFLGAAPQSSALLMGVPPLILLTARILLGLANGFVEVGHRWWPALGPGSRLYHSFACNLFLIPVLINGLMYGSVLWVSPEKAPLPGSDRQRYIEGLASGFGVKEAALFLAGQGRYYHARTGAPLTLLLPNQPGNPAEGISVYLFREATIRQVPAFWWPESPNIFPTRVRFTWRPSIYQYYPAERRESHLLDHALFVFPNTGYDRAEFERHNPEFQLTWSFDKPGRGESLVLYRHVPAS